MPKIVKVRPGQQIKIGDALVRVLRRTGNSTLELSIDAPREVILGRVEETAAQPGTGPEKPAPSKRLGN